MRIIDKNHDFYDYLQEPTDTLVFDRRGSFLLDKKRICDAMYHCNFRTEDYSHSLISVQCGAAFWLFLATVTKFVDDSWTYRSNEMPEDYELELLMSWKNYDIESKPIRVAVHECSWYRWENDDPKTGKYNISEQDLKNDTALGNRIQLGGYDVSTMETSVSTKNGYNKIVYNIPLLRGLGIANLINPVEIFCGIEEHFSRAKTASERTEPIGATNDDKITMHGFDTKTSFRGKN